MTREEKAKYIDELAAELAANSIVYLTDTADLNVESINTLRRRCFQSNIKLRVVKNALLEKAMDRVESKDYEGLKDTLKGSTSIMFSEVANAPAKLIQDFRKKNAKPILKGAYIDEAIFVGDNQLAVLEALKSKEELVGEIIGLLQSPAKNVLSGLKGAGGKLAGILKTLEERA
jgi:large subunit ribosomal protein L10